MPKIVKIPASDGKYRLMYLTIMGSLFNLTETHIETLDALMELCPECFGTRGTRDALAKSIGLPNELTLNNRIKELKDRGAVQYDQELKAYTYNPLLICPEDMDLRINFINIAPYGKSNGSIPKLQEGN